MLYARALLLRNCGRFTVVASDFGSDYRTHTHVTSEALYASLTRGATWRPHTIDLRHDPDSFTAAYDLAALPLWFTPGLFRSSGSYYLSEDHLDTSAFNVINELYPSTSTAYSLKQGKLEVGKRPAHVPSYGTIQAVLPDRRLSAHAFAADHRLLEDFDQGQTFFMGKKRTMFQILECSPVVEGIRKPGACTTGWLELSPTSGARFQSFEVAAATMRYLIIRGTTRDEGWYVECPFDDRSLCLPDFYIDQLPIRLLQN